MAEKIFYSILLIVFAIVMFWIVDKIFQYIHWIIYTTIENNRIKAQALWKIAECMEKQTESKKETDK